MKLTNILLVLLGHMILIFFHHYHINIVGVNPLQFTGFMVLHAIWYYFTAKRAYIRI
jgi:hypothetical protein